MFNKLKAVPFDLPPRARHYGGMAGRKTARLNNVLLVTERNYLPTLLQLLEHATQSVDLLAYSFAIGATTTRRSNAAFEVAEKLVEIKTKQKRMNIRVYFEGKRETSLRNRMTGDYLKKAGIKVKYGATHAKGFCIDGRYVLFGSTNLTNQSIAKNNETNLFFDERSVTTGFQAYFDHLWKGGTHGGIKLKPPMHADGAFMKALVELIDSAKKTLDFSIYFFHHTELEKALIRAQKRGVKVTGFIHRHNTFAMNYVRRTGGTAQRLLQGGIKNIFFGPPHLFTHSKYIVKDGDEILLGTGNWLHEDVLVHPQLYVQFQNPDIAKELTSHLKLQIKEQGERVRSHGQKRKSDLIQI